MTKRERMQLRKAIALIAEDDGENDGWHQGMTILMRLAGHKSQHAASPRRQHNIGEVVAMLKAKNGT